MALACPTGSTSSPKPGFLHSLEWSAVSFINSAVLDILSPFLTLIGSAFAPQLFSVDAMCASPPDIPAPLANGDILGVIGDITQFSPFTLQFMIKVNEYVRYGMFENFCQCSAVPLTPPTTTPCVTQYFDLSPSDWVTGGCNLPGTCAYFSSLTVNNPYPTTGHKFEFTALPLTDPPGFNVEFYSFGYGDVRVPVTAITPGTPVDGSYATAAVSGGNGWTIMFNTSAGLAPPNHFQFKMDWFPDTSETCSTSTQPVPPQPPTITAPAPPANACDSTSLCNVSWATLSLVENNFVNPSSPVVTTYVLGANHTVSGQGELTVAADLVGVLVTLASVAPGTGMTESDPVRYFDTGFISFRNADGYTAAERVIHVTQIMMTDLQSVTQVAYTCDMTTSMVITELIRSA